MLNRVPKASASCVWSTSRKTGCIRRRCAVVVNMLWRSVACVRAWPTTTDSASICSCVVTSCYEVLQVTAAANGVITIVITVLLQVRRSTQCSLPRQPSRLALSLRDWDYAKHRCGKIVNMEDRLSLVYSIGRKVFSPSACREAGTQRTHVRRNDIEFQRTSNHCTGSAAPT